MNRRLLIALTILAALLAGGAAYLARRRPAAPPQEAEAPPFQSQAVGAALLLRHADESTPLRALRWLPVGKGGFQVAQITTQTDRQRVALFENGSFAGIWLVPRPENVGEGFFRFAVLSQAVVTTSDLFLLYRAAEGGRNEAPLLLALDRKEGLVRWARRTTGARLVPQPGIEEPAALWCHGAQVPPQRIDPRSGQAGGPLELPLEIQAPGELLPTRNGLLLIAHASGLALRRRDAWLQHPVPAQDSEDTPQDPPFTGALAAGAMGPWWQARPDLIIPVRADGSLGEAIPLLLPEPWNGDGRHLRLLGVDPDGHLWFGLSGTPAPAPMQSDDAWTDTGNPSPETPATALVSNTPRLYRFDPVQRRFDLCRLDLAWKALQLPFALPSAFDGFAPEGGAWTPALADGSLLWIPLTRLPLTALDPQPR